MGSEENKGSGNRVGEPPSSIIGDGESGGTNDDVNSGANEHDAPGIRDTGESIAGFRVGKPDSGNSSGNAPYGYRADGTPAKKRGRKPGAGKSGSSPGAAKKKSDSGVSGLERLLYSMHMMAAIKLEMPMVALDKSESKMLADAIEAVQDHYGFDVSPEVAIWVNLASALGTVYGPRALLIYNKKKTAKKDKKENDKPKATVTNIADGKKPPAGMIFNIPGMHEPLDS